MLVIAPLSGNTSGTNTQDTSKMNAHPACLIQPGQSIVFDGDSMTARRCGPSLDTWAYLRLMNWERSYADRVDEWIFCNRPDLNVKCHNAAVGGSTASNCLNRYEAFVKPQKPSLVIMTIGGNDSAQRVPLAEFEKTLTAYCEQLAKDSNGRLMILTGFKPFPFRPEDEPKFNERTKYYQVTRRVLESHNGILVDVGTPLFEKAGQLKKLWEGHTIYSDGNHLNEVGCEIVATQVLKALGLITITE